ncbi:MAG: hypothetical protein J3R72DRAFT_494714 [Linnemannia gamsii]|nr:MAG: hypothetical protein J3R72DRAFT_494714 [Linnemannia gamsii]
MEDGSKAVEHRQDVAFCTHQLFMMAKKANIHIYKRLCALGLFKLLEFAFTAESDRVKVAGIEIPLMAMEKSSSLVHFHGVEQAKFKSDKGFLNPIIDLFLRNDDTELISRSSEVIGSMMRIDPYGPDENGLVHVGEHPPTSAERSSYEKRVVVLFMDVFFNKYILHVLAPVVQLKKATADVDRATAARCADICKLLSLLVRQRFLRTKIFTLLMSPQALKFFQTCLHSEDGYYYRNMIEYKAVHGVVGLLKDTKGKYNVINSACLMFFETILKMNNKALVSHCATVHRRALEEITYTPIFKALLTLHAGNGVRSSSSNRATNGSGDGTPGPSSKPMQGHHSRFLPGMRIPLSPSSNNQDNADAGVKALLSNSIRYEQKETTVDGVGASSGVTSGVLSYGNRQRTNNFTGTGSSTSLSPLPPVASQSGVFFLEAGEDRNGGSEHVTFTDTDPELIASVTSKHVADIYSGAGPLMLEGTARASDNGVESELKLKRKRDLEPTEADGPVQQKFKKDARSIPSFRIPLFSRRSNHGNLNSSSKAFLPKPHHRKQKETGIDGVETSSDGAANGESSNGTRTNVNSSTGTLPSQPSPTLSKTIFDRDATPGNIADTISGATQLIPKDAAVASDNGAETAIKLKRKRGHESDPEPTEADGPAQQRFKLDARYISGFRIPLFSRRSNHGDSSNGNSTHVNSSANTGSSPLLSPLPLVTLHSEIAFLKAGEGRDSNSEHATITESDSEHTTVTESDSVSVIDTDREHVADVKLGRVASAASEHVANSESDATRLIPEVASGTGGSGAESAPRLKRKRDEDDESDPGVIDAPMQRRPKLDVTESEGVSQSLVMPQEQTLIALDNTSFTTDINRNSLEDSNTSKASHHSP